MPVKLNMVIQNGSASLQQRVVFQKNSASLAIAPKAPSALNAPFIARIHNVRPGCGSCGRH